MVHRVSATEDWLLLLEPYRRQNSILLNRYIYPGAVVEWLRLHTEGHMPPLHGFETHHGLLPANLCLMIEMKCDVPIQCK